MVHRYKETWPEKKRIEAVTTYLALGKLPFVTQVTGIPHETLRVWKKQDWWKDLESQIRTEENQELDTKLTKIVDKSLSVVVDRLENGEFFMDKTGKVHRVPVKLKDAIKVSSDLLDKRSLIRKEPARQLAEKQESINERLLGLAEQFAAIALGKDPRKTEKVIEGEVLDEVYFTENSTNMQTMPEETNTKELHITENKEQDLYKNNMQDMLCWKSEEESCP